MVDSFNAETFVTLKKGSLRWLLELDEVKLRTDAAPK